MTESRFTSAADLIKGVIKGEVPRPVRRFAAQCLLPAAQASETLSQVKPILWAA